MFTLVLTLLGTFAHAQSGEATLDGTDCGTAGCQTYSVDLSTDGSFLDSYNRQGSYTLLATATGGRELTLDMGRAGVTKLAEGPQNCWEEATPPVNPGLEQIAICLTPKEHHLAHYDPDCDDTMAAPLFVGTAIAPQEDGHWVAGRLTPSSPGGFWVHEVGYMVYTNPNFQDFNCSPIDHRVKVFVGSAANDPPAVPAVVQEVTIDGATLVDHWSRVTVDLAAPLFVAAGESVFVSYEMLNDGNEAVCMVQCGYAPGQPDLTWWSDAVTAPFAWYDLGAIPNYYDLTVWADGIAASP